MELLHRSLNCKKYLSALVGYMLPVRAGLFNVMLIFFNWIDVVFSEEKKKEKKKSMK